MIRLDGRHRVQLSVDQLDPVALVEDAGVDHPVVGVHPQAKHRMGLRWGRVRLDDGHEATSQVIKKRERDQGSGRRTRERPKH
jgi:hypothetical protein